VTIRAVLFDLDETLITDRAATNAALVATDRLAGAAGVDAVTLATAVRRHAGELWRAASTIDYCRAAGISPWEGLWAGFRGDAPELRTLRDWAPTYRRESWRRALAEQGVDDALDRLAPPSQ